MADPSSPLLAPTGGAAHATTTSKKDGGGGGGMNPILRAVVVALCVAVVVGCWVAEAQLLQALQEPTSPAYYPKPYALTWFVRIGYNIFWLLWIPMRIWMARRGPSPRWWPALGDDEKRVLKHSVWLSAMFFMSGYLWYISLPRTSVAGNTIIFNMMPVVVLPFSVLLLHDFMSWSRLAALILGVGGMVLVVLASTSGKEDTKKHARGGGAPQQQTLGGYVAILVSMLLFSLFEVLFARFVSLHHLEHEVAEKQEADAIKRASLISEDDDVVDDEEAADRADHISYDSRDAGAIAVNSTGSLATPAMTTSMAAAVPLAPAGGTAKKGARGKVEDEEDDDGAEEENESEKKLVGARNMLLFLSMFGLVSTALMWPGLPFLNWIKMEHFDAPTAPQLELMGIASGLDTALNLAWLLVVVLMSPNFMALASLLSIPTSMVSDFLLKGEEMAPAAYIGTAIIFTGYVFYALRPLAEKFLKGEQKAKFLEARNLRMRW